MFFIIISDYQNEKQLVNEFLKYTYSNPLPVHNEERRRLFIWGNEIWLADGKNRNKAGKLDLIGTDELGDVWLIEAKLCSNIELNKSIWEKQLDPYRFSLSKRTENEIVLGSRNYLMSRISIDIRPPYLKVDIIGLFHAFEQWCSYWGLINKPNYLYDKTLEKIKTGDIFSCVLADIPVINVWDNRRSSFNNGGFIYIFFQPNEINVTVDNKLHASSSEDIKFLRGTFDTYLKQKRVIKPTPETVPLYLADEVLEYYNTIMNYLIKLGWDLKVGAINDKAFVINLPTKYDADISIHVGWMDADASVDIKYRTFHTFGLKFNIDFRHFKKKKELYSKCYTLAKRLAKDAQYSGRNSAIEINKRDLTNVEYEEWDGEMYRFVDRYNRDYIGMEEERKDLEAALRFLEDIVTIEPKTNKLMRSRNTKENEKVLGDFNLFDF